MEKLAKTLRANESFPKLTPRYRKMFDKKLAEFIQKKLESLNALSYGRMENQIIGNAKAEFINRIMGVAIKAYLAKHSISANNSDPQDYANKFIRSDIVEECLLDATAKYYEKIQMIKESQIDMDPDDLNFYYIAYNVARNIARKLEREVDRQIEYDDNIQVRHAGGHVAARNGSDWEGIPGVRYPSWENANYEDQVIAMTDHKRAIDSLPERKQHIARLLFNGSTPKRVAEILGCSVRYAQVIQKELREIFEWTPNKRGVTKRRKHLKAGSLRVAEVAHVTEAYKAVSANSAGEKVLPRTCPYIRSNDEQILYFLGRERMRVYEVAKIMNCSEDHVRQVRDAYISRNDAG